MVKLDIILLLRLLFAHFLLSFLVVPETWRSEWRSMRWKSGKLYVSAFIYAVFVYIFSTLWFQFWLPVLIGLSHILFDVFYLNPEDEEWDFLLKQLVHISILLGCWVFFLFKGSSEQILIANSSGFALRLWNLLFFYFLIFYPVGVLIGKATEKWRRNISEDYRIGLENAGTWIGRFERILILTFVLLGNYQAIGFLVAAKSIFRFGEVTNPKTRKEAEYILIGTLASVTSAIIIGILAAFIWTL